VGRRRRRRILTERDHGQGPALDVGEASHGLLHDGLGSMALDLNYGTRSDQDVIFGDSANAVCSDRDSSWLPEPTGRALH
jgi:hypothetical protein